MKNQSWFVTALLGLLLGGLVYIFFFKPRQAELNALRAERVSLENEVTTLRAKKVQLNKIEAELVDLNKALAELETIIPRKKESGEILRSVQQMAMDSQLDLIHYTPEKEVARDFYSEQPIPIEVVGNYHHLGLFFDRILHFQRIFNIDDFSIQALPAQSEESTISAIFTARTYFFFDESQIKKAEANRPQPQKPIKETDEIR
ncbi:MAG: type 4a pilus biogenesis protein PilO [Candidatus Aminicenantes bacterium]|nr:type 4a pilus biogenesis protein PilO [Candidatus Aminicenantes bacterium]